MDSLQFIKRAGLPNLRFRVVQDRLEVEEEVEEVCSYSATPGV